MIHTTTGNLLKADVDALVNTVNTVGVMGKGIALQFKRAFPEAYRDYRKACENGSVQLGKMHVVDLGGLTRHPRYIINFPTKKHWRSKSRLEDIKSGLKDLRETIDRLEIRSIALPPLGCGHGGLEWQPVKRLIYEALASLDNTNILLFEPKGAPLASDMVDRTEKPKMTHGTASLILAMNRYLEGMLTPIVTLIEIHKIMYLIQVQGYSLNLNYAKGKYGPYASNLRHLLSRIESHYITGFGDASDTPLSQLKLLSGAVEDARRFIDTNDLVDLHRCLNEVGKLIDGFEDPQGLELLTSVHWVVAHADSVLSTEQIITQVRGWSERKHRILKPTAITKATDRLASSGWLKFSQN